MVSQELWGAQNLQKSIRQGFYAQEADVWKRERYVVWSREETSNSG